MKKNTFIKSYVETCDYQAKKEMEYYGITTFDQYNRVYQIGMDLAERRSADTTIVCASLSLSFVQLNKYNGDELNFHYAKDLLIHSGALDDDIQHIIDTLTAFFEKKQNLTNIESIVVCEALEYL